MHSPLPSPNVVLQGLQFACFFLKLKGHWQGEEGGGGGGGIVQVGTVKFTVKITPNCLNSVVSDCVEKMFLFFF